MTRTILLNVIVLCLLTYSGHTSNIRVEKSILKSVFIASEVA